LLVPNVHIKSIGTNELRRRVIPLIFHECIQILHKKSDAI